MIEVQGLCKSFGRGRQRVPIVRHVSFTCEAGAVYGLLGPNGAGKTTTLRLISTALSPDAGTIRVAGIDAVKSPEQARRQFGFLSANTGLYGRLTPREVLRYFGDLHGMPRAATDARIVQLAETFQFADFLTRPCEKLSTGMKQKINIARTVLHDPPVIIFDEPTAGLDILASRAIVDFVRTCRAEGRTLLFSTHIMGEVDRLCDQVGIIHRGQLVFNGDLATFRATHGDDLEEGFLRVLEGAPA